jgi:hypothetical protein
VETNDKELRDVVADGLAEALETMERVTDFTAERCSCASHDDSLKYTYICGALRMTCISIKSLTAGIAGLFEEDGPDGEEAD